MYNPETNEIVLPNSDEEAEHLSDEGFLPIRDLDVLDRLHAVARKGSRFTLKPGALLDAVKTAAAKPAKRPARKRK